MRPTTSFGALLALLALGFAACGDSGDTTASTTTGSSTGTGGDGTGGGVTGTPLKVMNWNLHNLQNDLNDSDNTLYPDEAIQTTAQYQEQLSAIAAVMIEMDPDVAIFAEVENEAVLDDLDAAIGGKYPHRSVIDANDDRGVDNGAVSKIPFTSVVSHKDDMFVMEGTAAPTYTFARDCVEYHLTFEGQDIALLGVHYRSKGPPDDANKRLAEAQRSRAIADELLAADPSLALAVLGDFNDLPGSFPVEAVAGSDFVDVAENVEAGERWTFDFMGAQELIDHQMVNPVLLGHLDPSSVTILRNTDTGTASDHAPMMATYRF